MEIGTATLVHAATAVYVLGFLFRNQFILRGLVLLGSILYILYYYYHNGVPQWDAIAGSVLIGLATLIGMVGLIYSRLPIGISADHRKIYDTFYSLEPGEFRALMRIAKVIVTDQPVTMTTQDALPQKLYFTLEGRPLIQKGDMAFRVDPGGFIGEVGFLLGAGASATVSLPEGGTFVEWERDRLLRLLDRKPPLRQAFDALIGRDMAQKVAEGAHATAKKIDLSSVKGPETLSLEHAPSDADR